jgi:endonuclease YncB( thermonuclease family)
MCPDDDTLTNLESVARESKRGLWAELPLCAALEIQEGETVKMIGLT